MMNMHDEYITANIRRHEASLLFKVMYFLVADLELEQRQLRSPWKHTFSAKSLLESDLTEKKAHISATLSLVKFYMTTVSNFPPVSLCKNVTESLVTTWAVKSLSSKTSCRYSQGYITVQSMFELTWEQSDIIDIIFNRLNVSSESNQWAALLMTHSESCSMCSERLCLGGLESLLHSKIIYLFAFLLCLLLYRG